MVKNIYTHVVPVVFELTMPLKMTLNFQFSYSKLPRAGIINLSPYPALYFAILTDVVSLLHAGTN